MGKKHWLEKQKASKIGNKKAGVERNMYKRITKREVRAGLSGAL
jgi:hypothetical protein